jgi:hypothetical protein
MCPTIPGPTALDSFQQSDWTNLETGIMGNVIADMAEIRSAAAGENCPFRFRNGIIGIQYAALLNKGMLIKSGLYSNSVNLRNVPRNN